MKPKKELKIVGFIVKNGEKHRRDQLPQPEQKRLAYAWNSMAMRAAGFIKTEREESMSERKWTI